MSSLLKKQIEKQNFSIFFDKKSNAQKVISFSFSIFANNWIKHTGVLYPYFNYRSKLIKSIGLLILLI